MTTTNSIVFKSNMSVPCGDSKVPYYKVRDNDLHVMLPTIFPSPSSAYKHPWSSSSNIATSTLSSIRLEPTQNMAGQNMTAVPLPREMTFNDDSIMSVIAYACLFVVAASGNLIVFITLFRSRRIKSRVNTFIMHLSIADLIVAFIMLPLETGWHITVRWEAGDAACRILMFFRALGFYLSSFVLVTISLDRYFSIVHPMSLHDAERRGKIMLTLAWLLSAVASLPQVRCTYIAQTNLRNYN